MYRFFPLLLLLWLPVLLLGACGPLAAPPTPLRVGMHTQWVGFGPFYVAASRQLYDPAPVKIVSLPSLDDAYRAFKERRVDAAGMTLFEALPLADVGIPLNIVMVVDYSNGADGMVARREIVQVSDLEGKRVGIMRNSFNHFLLLAALDRAGLQEHDVNLVDMSLENAATAFERGDLDATVTWDPMLTELASKDDAHTIFTSADVPGVIVDVLVVHKDIVDQRPSDMAALIAGWEKALQVWRMQPDEAVRITAQAMALTPEEVVASLSGIELTDLEANRRLFDPRSEQSLWRTYAEVSSFMMEHQLLTHDAPPDRDIINPRFVDTERIGR